MYRIWVGTRDTSIRFLDDRILCSIFWRGHENGAFQLWRKLCILIHTCPCTQVLRRCYSTLIPTNSNYLSQHLSSNPDLYGPFWTLTTLIFALFVCSSLASALAAYLSHPDAQNLVQYNWGLLSIAVALVYIYGLGVPIGLWLSLRYLGVGEWSMIEAVALWGYGQFVWIPVSVSIFLHLLVHTVQNSPTVEHSSYAWFLFLLCAGSWWESHFCFRGPSSSWTYTPFLLA